MRLNRILYGLKVACDEFKKSYRRPTNQHPLEKEATRRSIELTMPSEAWKTLREFLDFFERHDPGITPTLHGYLLVAGLIKVRQRILVVGSFMKALKDLCNALEHFESTLDVFHLGPRSGQVQTQTADLDVSMDNAAWRLFDGLAVISKEVTPDRAAVINGYVLLFGMWWYKDLLLHHADGALDAMKQLLVQSQGVW